MNGKEKQAKKVRDILNENNELKPIKREVIRYVG